MTQEEIQIALELAHLPTGEDRLRDLDWIDRAKRVIEALAGELRQQRTQDNDFGDRLREALDKAILDRTQHAATLAPGARLLSMGVHLQPHQAEVFVDVRLGVRAT